MVVQAVQHLAVIGTARADVRDSTDYTAVVAPVITAEHAFIHILPTAADTAWVGPESVLDS